MKFASLSLSASVLVFASLGMAAPMDGSDVPACKGVTDVCMAAQVTSTDSKTQKSVTGYQPGEHGRDGKGLWADCVGVIAKGGSAPGVTGVTQAAAKTCMQAQHAAHPKNK